MAVGQVVQGPVPFYFFEGRSLGDDGAPDEPVEAARVDILVTWQWSTRTRPGSIMETRAQGAITIPLSQIRSSRSVWLSSELKAR